MWLSILIFLLSIIPSVLIIVLLQKRNKGDKLYKKNCNKFMAGGFISVLPILAVSGTFYILNVVLKKTVFKDLNPLVGQAVYTYIVLAFAEEIVKFLTFVIVLRKVKHSYSWADIVAYMVILGTAFGLIEDIPYAVGADAMTMLIRGFTMGHVGYALITGWFYGKSIQTGKKGYMAAAVLVPWVIHGTYDFSLCKELTEINDNLMFLAFGLALLDVVLLIMMIVFFARTVKKKADKYQTLIVTFPEDNIVPLDIEPISDEDATVAGIATDAKNEEEVNSGPNTEEDITEE